MDITNIPTSFRFLDLPKELRLTVYEQLPVITRHSKVQPIVSRDERDKIALVLKVLPQAILKVSRSIHHEAHAVLQPKMCELLSESPQIAFSEFNTSQTNPVFRIFMQAVMPSHNLELAGYLTSFRVGERTTALFRRRCLERGIVILSDYILPRWIQPANLCFHNAWHLISTQLAVDRASSP